MKGRPKEPAEVVRSEEELRVRTETVVAGSVRAHKTIETDHVEQTVPRDIEHAEVERVAADATDSGQIETLADGSISIPVFEEQLVIEKRLVVRERVIIRKSSTTEQHPVEADLRRERVHVDVDPAVVDRVTDEDH